MAETTIKLPSAVAMAADIAKIVTPLGIQAEAEFYDFLFARAGKEISRREFVAIVLKSLELFRGRHLRVDKHVEALAGRENAWLADQVNGMLTQAGGVKSTIQLLR